NRGRCRANLTGSVHFNGDAHYCCSVHAGDKRCGLCSLRADADGIGLCGNTYVANIDIIRAGGEIPAGILANDYVMTATVTYHSRITNARVAVTCKVVVDGTSAKGRV